MRIEKTIFFQKTKKIKETETGFILGKNNINFPFYVFDYTNNSLHLVKNKNDYNKFLK